MMFSTEFSFSAVSSETRMNRLRISFFYRVSLSLFFRLHFTEIHRREREIGDRAHQSESKEIRQKRTGTAEEEEEEEVEKVVEKGEEEEEQE